ncbi:uncharacterized protein LOC125770108 isoform X3 [Anopheles funestus]|uniref:uncharacterized protein LOC125770108 isoform 1 n=1 Tax=Anopheles funestus TaxID=62324 RepID=UPI0020C6498E|nr:uncharacterized protein LOC125770108 isoform 1 [Anopheles funestus]NP_001405247.1 uncharacterized protein LOC125770108 isoform 1 [Anopheles funestus]XP_049295306.1 uncharacterized protein LOC125770108 isoform X3 [Anopheles funestus]
MNIIWNCLVVAGIINERGEILTDNIDSTKLEEILTPEISQYKHRVSFLLKKCVNREKHIKVPNFLKKFVERHLSSWIRSAINALLMAPGQSYVVDYKKSGSKADRNASIIILDNDTGADQGSSQWDEALHQFLQLKHGCKLSMQSLKAVFVSNVTYFKMYKLLYGLTGTLGSERERNLLKDIHNVAFVTIPTAKPKQFEEYEPIISGGYRTWRKNITTEVCKLINEEKRSVLIICDTINDAESIKDTLKGMFPTQLHTYTRDYQEFDIVEGCKQLQQGQIIIATNLAGRGTDIRITDALKQSGGLHVILTYLPENIRIEEQAFGRAARSGDKGSGQLIIMVSSQRQYRRSKIIELKKTRDENELYRISDIKTYYEKTIKAEEICFDEFKQVYEKHRKSLEAVDVPSEVTTILLQNCLDQWSFWLDEHSRYMENIMQECDERGVPTLVQTFVSKLSGFESGKCVKDAVRISYFKSQKWKDWVEGNPMQMIKLANYLSGTNLKKCRMTEDELLEYAFDIFETNQENGVTHYGIINYGMLLADETAMSLYDDVIKIEPQFSEAAHYYRAYTLMKSIEQEETLQSEENKKKYKDFKKHLREAIRLFEDHHAFALQAAIITNNLKGNNVWHDEYQAQKDTIAKLYQTFIRSIEDIFGHAVSHNTFVTDEIKENVAEHIFMQLIEKGVISRPKVRKTISEQQLRMIHNDYGVSIEVLKKFLSENAGLIVEEEFIKACKENIPLPSREEFWQLLIDQKVLNSIKKYAIVDKAKLEALDPSLKDALDGKIADKTFVTETIEPTPGQIVLYREELSLRSTENNDSETNTIVPYVIFEKEYFVSLIGKEKFEMMVKKDIIRCNEMANVDRDMIASCKFSSFDSISVEDIVLRANIAQVEAELIMEELINREVLERKGECFVLNESFSGSEEELLPSYPLYEDTIRDLLSSCFAYRLALNHIEEQLEKDDQILHMPLKCNCYPQFFQDLITHDIIRPPKWSKVKEDKFLEILNEVFNSLKCYTEVNNWLKKLLHISTEDSKRLFEDLFLTSLDRMGDAKITDVNLSERINKSKGFAPLNQAKELLQYDMRKTIEQLCMQLDLFFKTETKSHVESVLGQIKPSIIGLKVPSINLKSIREAGNTIEKNFGTIEEEKLLTLNGLANHIEVVDKNSTNSTLSKWIVLGIGIAQTVVGLTAGALSFVGSALISEGINDILYALSSFTTGYFSWQNYMEQKYKSMLVTAYTSGIKAYVKLSGMLSRYVSNINGFLGNLMKRYNYVFKNTTSKILAQLNKSSLMKYINVQIESLQYLVRLVEKSLTHTLFDVILIQNIIRRIKTEETKTTVEKKTTLEVKPHHSNNVDTQGLFNSIITELLQQIMSKFDNHIVFQNLRIIYNELGEQQAQILVHEIPDFASIDWKVYTSAVKQITCILSKEVTSDIKNSIKETKTKENLTNVSTKWVWNNCAEEIEKLSSTVETFLDSLDTKIQEKSKTMVQRASLTQNVQPNVRSFEQFRADVIKEWKMQLSNHLDTIILQPLIKPLFDDALFGVTQTNKRLLHNYNDGRLTRKLRKDRLKQDYHEKLKQIMSKTKSPTLFAAIIRENVPMDLTCVAACTSPVYMLLKRLGIDVKGIVITVQGENGIEETFHSGATEGENVRNVTLQLRNNHFIFSENQLDVPDNNCLYAALVDAIPELINIEARTFREKIANAIENDPKVQHLIRQGWHRYPIMKYNAIGGRAPKRTGDKLNKKKKTNKRSESNDASERAFEDTYLSEVAMEYVNYMPPENCPTARSPNLHLFLRFTFYPVGFAALLQAVGRTYNHTLEQMVANGASNCFDNSNVVPGGFIHRAHRVRCIVDPFSPENVKKINNKKVNRTNEERKENLKPIHRKALEIIEKYAGSRENVLKDANRFDKIGGWIDRTQFELIALFFNSFDFSKDPTNDDINELQKWVEDIVNRFLDYFESHKHQYDETMIAEIERVTQRLLYLDYKELFMYGKFIFHHIIEFISKLGGPGDLDGGGT